MSLLGAGCSRCGQPYSEDGIRVLAQREEIAFVQLVCFACETQTLALVTGSTAGGEEASGLDGDEVATGRRGSTRPARREAGEHGEGTGTADAPPEPEAPPISEVDVAEMVEFLAGYEGDLQTLLRPRDGGLGRR